MSRLRRLVPAPLASVVLLASWLALARSVSVAHVLLGLGLALVVPWLTSKLRATSVHAQKPLTIARFVITVAYDVLVSNVVVASGVVTWRWRRPRSKFVVVPLELRDPVGLAALAMVTTIVPGTVWSELALDRGALLLHVWNVGEEQAFVARFKARYEKPLKEIFE
ncbi:MAG TPA: Na+/H+ antiporter subunit E [Polyangiaceae bacterium]